MKIGELAKATGLPVKTLRFYEGEGLVPNPPRTPSGYRVYGATAVERVTFIKRAKLLGLSLMEIKQVLDLYDRGTALCAHVQALLDQKLAELDRAVEDLQDVREELVRIRDKTGPDVDCRPAPGRVCGIIENARV